MFFCLLDIDKDCRLQNSSGASCGLYALYIYAVDLARLQLISAKLIRERAELTASSVEFLLFSAGMQAALSVQFVPAVWIRELNP